MEPSNPHHGFVPGGPSPKPHFATGVGMAVQDESNPFRPLSTGPNHVVGLMTTSIPNANGTQALPTPPHFAGAGTPGAAADAMGSAADASGNKWQKWTNAPSCNPIQPTGQSIMVTHGDVVPEDMKREIGEAIRKAELRDREIAASKQEGTPQTGDTPMSVRSEAQTEGEKEAAPPTPSSAVSAVSAAATPPLTVVANLPVNPQTQTQAGKAPETGPTQTQGPTVIRERPPAPSGNHSSHGLPRVVTSTISFGQSKHQLVSVYSNNADEMVPRERETELVSGVYPQGTQGQRPDQGPVKREGVHPQVKREPVKQEAPAEAPIQPGVHLDSAKSYLRRVRDACENRPSVFRHFVETMTEFKERNIEPVVVVLRVHYLLRGGKLLVELNHFLPPQIHFTPDGKLGQYVKDRRDGKNGSPPIDLSQYVPADDLEINAKGQKVIKRRPMHCLPDRRAPVGSSDSISLHDQADMKRAVAK
ncbi:hypothetical protein KIPB_007629, partial [Kipferlia bialata]|eukprot:g7629.t1